MKSIKSTASQVNAILEGRRTMFREVVKQPKNCEELGRWDIKCPHKVGDKIFVKEDHSMGHGEMLTRNSYRDVWYWADGKPKIGVWKKFLSAHYMKQGQSRITLEITDIRVERLGEISEEDAEKEGARPAFTRTTQINYPVVSKPRYVWGFEELWNSICKNKPAKSWESNPFVWVLTFKKI
jgi:hypothetical protein